MKIDTLFVKNVEKCCDFETFGRSSFVQDTKREQNVVKDIQVMRIIENLRDQDKLVSRKK